MPRPLATCLLLLAFARAHGVEAPPDLPDPFGLGPRLVLLDHLRTKYGLKPPEDASYEQLVEMYWKVEKPGQGQPAITLDDATMVEDEAQVRDRVNRLRAVLKEEFKYDAPATATEADLVAELRKRRDQRQQQAIDDSTKRNQHEHAVASVGAADDTAAPTKAEDATVAAAAASGDMGPLWRKTIHETWQSEDAIRLDDPPVWQPIEAPLAENANPNRVRRNHGTFEYPNRLPPWEEGMEVWIQHQSEGYGGHVEPRWYPALWIPETREWTIENPACYRWEREGKLYARLVQLLIAGPRSDEGRLKAWKTRRKELAGPVAPAAGNAAGDPGFLDVCAAAAKEGGFADQLAMIETDALAIEAEYPKLVDAHREYSAAADLLRSGNAQADPDKWRKALDQHSASIQELYVHRRRLLLALVTTIPK
jgi:hypothetical protein